MDKETKEEIGQLKASFGIMQGSLHNLEKGVHPILFRERLEQEKKHDNIVGISNVFLVLAFLFFIFAAGALTAHLWLRLFLMGVILTIASGVAANAANAAT